MRLSHFSPLLLLFLLLSAPAFADWLITDDGQRIETQGPWKLEGRSVIFTSAAGTLSSLRLSEVDLEASEAATAAALAPPPTAAERTGQEAPKKESVLVITDQDIASGGPVASGRDLLLQRFRQALDRGDVDAMMALVRWPRVAKDARRRYREQIEDLTQVEVLGVRVDDVGPEESFRAEVDGVTYEPTVEVDGRLVIEIAPTEDFDTASVSFLVGPHLGTYFIATEKPVDED